jgi:hypothetical protein
LPQGPENVKIFSTVKLTIEDKKGDHGGFLRNPDNIEKSRELFEKLVR